MRFAWNEAKSRANQAKHGVNFELATLVFDDPLALSLPDPFEGEERWRTMGLVKNAVLILVAHTIEEEDGDELIRIISARKATRHERKAYEESH